MTSQSPGITAELSLEIAHLQAQLQHDSTTCRCTSPRMNTRGHRSQMSRTFPSLHLNANRNDPRHQSSPKFIEFNEHQIPKFSGFFTGIHKDIKAVLNLSSLMNTKFQNSVVSSQVFTNGSYHTHLCGTYHRPPPKKYNHLHKKNLLSYTACRTSLKYKRRTYRAHACIGSETFYRHFWNHSKNYAHYKLKHLNG